ncbi:hypothetical protein FHS15_002396 [Paenibacillus castaneae]|nr:hypothetical protein [Paenibacillus castaneae]
MQGKLRAVKFYLFVPSFLFFSTSIILRSRSGNGKPIRP